MAMGEKEEITTEERQVVEPVMHEPVIHMHKAEVVAAGSFGEAAAAAGGAVLCIMALAEVLPLTLAAVRHT